MLMKMDYIIRYNIYILIIILAFVKCIIPPINIPAPPADQVRPILIEDFEGMYFGDFIEPKSGEFLSLPGTKFESEGWSTSQGPVTPIFWRLSVSKDGYNSRKALRLQWNTKNRTWANCEISFAKPIKLDFHTEVDFYVKALKKSSFSIGITVRQPAYDKEIFFTSPVTIEQNLNYKKVYVPFSLFSVPDFFIKRNFADKSLPFTSIPPNGLVTKFTISPDWNTEGDVLIDNLEFVAVDADIIKKREEEKKEEFLNLFSYKPLPVESVKVPNIVEGFEKGKLSSDIKFQGEFKTKKIVQPGHKSKYALAIEVTGRENFITWYNPEKLKLFTDRFITFSFYAKSSRKTEFGEEMLIKDDPYITENRMTKYQHRKILVKLYPKWKKYNLSFKSYKGEFVSFSIKIPKGMKVFLDDFTVSYRLPDNWGRRVSAGKVNGKKVLEKGRVLNVKVDKFNGFNFSVPEYVKDAPNSGYFYLDGGVSDYVKVNVAHVYWKQLEPQEGVYNFKPIFDVMKKGRYFGVRLSTTEKGRVPEWFIKKYKVKIFDVSELGSVEPWTPEHIQHYKKLFRALKRQGIIDSPKLAFWYMGGASRSSGEEMWFKPKDIKKFERNGHLTVEIFRKWLFDRINFLSEIFGKNTGKCTFMRTSGGFPGEYGNIVSDAYIYAIRKGFGLRGGFIEHFYQHIGDVRCGQMINFENNRIYVDEEHPLLTGRVYADEDEFWFTTEDMGNVIDWPYRYRHTIFSALHQRMNYLGIHDAVLKIDKQVTLYGEKNLGRTYKNAFDAFSYLHEGFLKGYGRVVNWERWLVQKENDGAKTLAGLKVDRSPLSTDTHKFHIDFEGRTTDIENGQYRFDFNLDDRLWQNYNSEIDVYVTYWNSGGSNFVLQWYGKDGNLYISPTVKVSINSRGYKTVCFHIPNLLNKNKLYGNSDISIISTNKCNLILILVRVVKLNKK